HRRMRRRHWLVTRDRRRSDPRMHGWVVGAAHRIAYRDLELGPLVSEQRVNVLSELIAARRADAPGVEPILGRVAEGGCRLEPIVWINRQRALANRLELPIDRGRELAQAWYLIVEKLLKHLER